MSAKAALAWVVANGTTLLIALAGLSLLMVVLGIQDCRHENEVEEKAREALRLRAALDRTKTIYEDENTRISERASFLAESLGMEVDEAKRAREELGRDLLVTSRTLARISARIEGAETTPEVGEESTFIPVPDSIPPFVLAGGVTVRGAHFTAGSSATWAIEIEVPDLALHVDITQDPESCALHVHVTSVDPAVEVTEVASSVQDELVDRCLDEGGGFPWAWLSLGELALIVLLAL